MESAEKPISDNIEVVPVVVVSQTFPARPSSIPDIRDFVRGCLAQSPLSAEDTREVGETVSAALLEAAGPTGAISVSFRIFPDHVEVDVLRSGSQGESTPGMDALTSLLRAPAPGPPAVAAGAGAATATAAAAGAAAAEVAAAEITGTEITDAEVAGAGVAGGGVSGTGAGGTEAAGTDSGPEDADAVTRSFAEWMSGVLRREGMSVESAARQLGVSVKTVSRWVGGSTEPRLRDLRRIHDLFGEVPFP